MRNIFIYRYPDICIRGCIIISNLLKNIQKNINKNISANIFCRELRNSIVLEGLVDNWDSIIKAGKSAANKGYKGVVNKLEAKNLKVPSIKSPNLQDHEIDNIHVDVLIIGGGVIGCAIARELSKWDIDILLVEKEDDLAVHASSRNDGMIHPGLNPKPGTKKSYYNIRGNKLYTKISQDLDVPLRRVGSYILFDKKGLKLLLPFIKIRANRNGVEGLEYLSDNELRKREPNISKDIVGGIFLPTTGVLSPYKMTVAFGENALLNGARISLNTQVHSMEKQSSKIVSVKTNRGIVYPKLIINAAGVYSDKIAEMADDEFFTIHPRKGHILLIDKKKGHLVDSVVAKFPIKNRNNNTKGGGIVKTIDDNILIGPDAIEQPYRENYSTSKENIDEILNKHMPLIALLSPKDVITYFAGIRAATYEEDFIIEESEYIENLIHAAGIQSPGLASAPAIAEDIEKITINKLKKLMNVLPKENWNPKRKGIPNLSKMNDDERNRYIKERPDYGVIICRCEEISRGEIIDAIKSPLPANSLDAIKRRVRPGMGRCQGGFCTPLVSQLMAEATDSNILSVTKKGNSSHILVSQTKNSAEESSEEKEESYGIL